MTGSICERNKSFGALRIDLGSHSVHAHTHTLQTWFNELSTCHMWLGVGPHHALLPTQSREEAGVPDAGPVPSFGLPCSRSTSR